MTGTARAMIGALALLSWPLASRASACGGVAPFAVVALTPNGSFDQGALVPLGSDVLIAYQCYCRQLDDEALDVEVTDAQGRLVAGSAHWLDVDPSAQAGAMFARWHPDTPLVPGSYHLHWAAPSTAQPNLTFIVGEDASADANEVVFDAALTTRLVSYGDQLYCTWNDCGQGQVTTRKLELPTIVLKPKHEPSGAESVAFLYRPVIVRASGQREPGVWRVVAAGEELDVDFEAPADEYCVDVETMRVSDGRVASLGERCIVHDAGELGVVPAAIESCDSQSRPGYIAAWCDDNAAACEAGPVGTGCGAYAATCGERSVIDGGAADAAMPITAHDAAPDAAPGSNLPTNAPRATGTSPSSSCAVGTGAGAGSRHGAWCFLFVLAALGVRRVGRGRSRQRPVARFSGRRSAAFL